jgi:hypothetical protein
MVAVMLKIIQLSGLTSPILLAMAVLVANPLQAAEPQSGRHLDRNRIAQVTSVSQLSDVEPTDWAFQALQSLVERYGCIAGYPDGTFRGNRPLTRYEFAAGLNACLDRIVELAQGGGRIDRGDLSTIRRLQEEFQAELATLRGRVDALEARTEELEANQFSTTTKLTGEVIFAATDGFGDGDDNQTVFQQRVRLNFNTSFTGEDLLITRLQVGNGTPLNAENSNDGVVYLNSTAEGFQTHQVFGDTDNTVVLDTLQYIFPVGDRLTVALAANAGIFDDFTPTLNPYFEDFDGGNGSISAFAQRNPIYRLGGGAGLGLSFQLTDSLEFTAGYLAAEGSDANEGNGLFDGDYAALGQITWSPNDRVGLALTYNRGYFGEGNFGFDNGGQTRRGFTGTTLANQLGANSAIESDSVGVQLALKLARGVQLNGWAGYTNVELLEDDTEGDIWNGAIALGFPDLGTQGSLLGIVVGVEPYLSDLDDFNDFFEDDVPLHVEAFYKYQLNDRISITPGAMWLSSPNQDSDNDDALIGTLRTTFTF